MKFVALFLFVNLSLAAYTQNSSQPSANQSSTRQDKKKPPISQTPVQGAGTQQSLQNTPSGNSTPQQALTDAVISSQDQDLGDWVPCEYTTAQLLQLRPVPESSTLTQFDSENLKKAVVAATGSPQFTGAVKVGVAPFVEKVLGDNFVGRTQSQAMNEVLTDYDNSINQNISSADNYMAKWAGTSGETQATSFGNLPSTTRNLLLALSIDPTKKPLNANDEASAKSQLANVQAQLQAQQPVIADAARTQTTNSLRPKDVFCSMSILTYDEARSAFGPLVAKSLIAVQVTVRNLNKDYEFQIHDAQFAVDSDPSGRHGRFFDGTDKKIVRSFAVAQQSFSARNLWVNGSQAVGSLANSIVPFIGGKIFGDAVSALTGAAIPGIGKVWKDQSTDQLNLVNDVAFTPGTGGTAVLRQGVTTFVMFIPSKPFENGWWTLPCANNSYMASTQADVAGASSGPFFREKRSGLTGLDIDKALEACLPGATPYALPAPNSGPSISKSGKSSPTYIAAPRVTDILSDSDLPSPIPPGSLKTDVFASVPAKQFKQWTGSALGIFRELVFVTISGAHTVEKSQLAASGSKISCNPPFDDKGNVTFNGTDPIVCTVSGQNLGTITKLRLRNDNNQSDSLDTALQPTSGDPSTGTVQFDANKLAALKGSTYSTLLVDNKDAETKTSIAMHFVTTINPVKVKIGSGSDIIDLTQTISQPITISGSHLDLVGKVVLTSVSDSSVTDSITVSKHDSAESLAFDLSTATNIKNAADKTGSTNPITVKITLQPTESSNKAVDAPESCNFNVKGASPSVEKPVAPVQPKSKTPAVPKPKAPNANHSGAVAKPKPGTPAPKPR